MRFKSSTTIWEILGFIFKISTTTREMFTSLTNFLIASNNMLVDIHYEYSYLSLSHQPIFLLNPTTGTRLDIHNKYNYTGNATSSCHIFQLHRKRTTWYEQNRTTWEMLLSTYFIFLQQIMNNLTLKMNTTTLELLSVLNLLLYCINNGRLNIQTEYNHPKNINLIYIFLRA